MGEERPEHLCYSYLIVFFLETRIFSSEAYYFNLLKFLYPLFQVIKIYLNMLIMNIQK